MVADFRRRFWVSLAATVPILLLSPAVRDLLGLGQYLRFSGHSYLLLALASFVFFYGGFPFLKGIAAELKAAAPGMMTLITVAITTAYAYSAAVTLGLAGKVFFWELATLIDVMLLGHWIEMKSVMGASRALEELARLMPTDAHKLMDDGSIQDVPLAEIRIGDRVLVRPGEKVPADGEVASGESSVNEAMMTGESKPVAKKPGAAVIGGSVNGEGSVTVTVDKVGNDSFLSQVIKLVHEAQASKSRAQDIASQAAMWLTIIALSIGTITFIVWFILEKKSFAFALERTVTVMVITCPHALGLAVPLVISMSTALAAKRGLLIRDRAAFERARRTQAIIFDKTGTLTEGRYGVTDIVPFAEVSERELLSLAAAVEARSEHPIARGIVSAAEDKLDRIAAAEKFQAIPGQGVWANVDGQEVMVVSPGYMR